MTAKEYNEYIVAYGRVDGGSDAHQQRYNKHTI